MSVITDLLIVTSADEAEAMARLNAWCHDNDSRQQTFEPISTDAAGGTKVFCARVWAMAANHFDWRGLAEAFPTFGWRWPVGVMLIAQYEHNDLALEAWRGDGASIEDGYAVGWAALD